MCITIKSISVDYEHKKEARASVMLDELGNAFLTIEIPADLRQQLLELAQKQLRGRGAAFAVNFVRGA